MKAASGLSNLADIKFTNPWEIKEISGTIGDFKALIVKSPIDEDRCIHCKECVDVCPQEAIDGVFTVGGSCDRCGECVKVCPVDAIEFDAEEMLEASQIIADGSLFDQRSRWGIYPVEAADYSASMDAALEALGNMGKIKKIKYIQTDMDRCAGGKSGLAGCTICEEVCGHGAIKREEDSIAFDEVSCFGCGSCASACPIQIPKLLDLRDELVFSKIEALLAGNLGVLMFTCDCGSEILDKVGKDRISYPPVLPLFVPCLGAVNELHVLKAFELGAKGVVFLKGSTCPHGIEGPTNSFRFAETALEALEFEDRITFIDGTEDIPSKLMSFVDGLSTLPIKKKRKAKKTVSKDKRDTLVEILLSLSEATGKSPTLIIKDSEFAFGSPIVGENCTICAACTNMCPTGALKGEGSGLDFIYHRCISCGLCAKACPEDVISIDNVLDFGRLVAGHKERLFSATLARCVKCGKEYASEGMVKSARARIQKAELESGGEFSLKDQLKLMDYCEDCRPLIALSTYQGEEHGD
jgi:ferredoxin